MPSSAKHILSFDSLDISYGGVQAVSDFSLDVDAGSIVGLVGESGSGKSSVLRAAAGLLGRSGSVDAGSVFFDGVDVVRLSRKEAARLRGSDIAYVFQDPMGSLDPLFSIGDQFDECIRAHRSMSTAAMHALEVELLEGMGFDDPERVLALRPFNLSGGMCQRVVLAFSLGCGARLLLADEPTSALDVTVQAQTLDLLRRLRTERGISILIVSHNMAVIAHLADYVGVMYQGQLVEFGTCDQVFQHPCHTYTRELIGAIPKVDGVWAKGDA